MLGIGGIDEQQTAKLIARIRHRAVWLYEEVNWITALFIIITPFVAAYGVATTAWVPKTWILVLICHVCGILGISGGYHRLYAHRTYSASRPVELFLLFWATTCFSMSAIDWCKDHRAHHKYTDTEKDPYNIKKGFFYAHVGWLLWYRKKLPKSDVKDLKRDPLLRWQHEQFRYLAIVSAWILPLLICGLGWNDWRGGFYIACVFKTVLLHHAIFSINSWAHYWGETTYNEDITPRDSLACAIWTLGEGYHNFHHEFPNDYRNGVHLTAFDPTKWFIASCEYFGQTFNVKRVSSEQIKLCKLQMIQRKVELEKSRIFTGVPVHLLPVYTPEQVRQRNEEGGTCLLTLGDMVYDASDFAHSHPGGAQYISAYAGKDIRAAFTGAVYAHSGAANNLLQTLRCGRLVHAHAE